MSILSRVKSAWRDAVHSDTANAELDAEIESYIEHLTADNIRMGFSPAEARRAAVIAAGGADQVKEDVRDAHPGLRADAVFLDMRHAFRSVSRAPGTAFVIVMTLALTIGANTAIYSLAHALLLERLPYRGVDRVVLVENPPVSVSLSGGQPGFALVKAVRQHRAVESHALFYPGGANLEGAQALRIPIAQVDPSFMRTLGAPPVLGRDFAPEDGVAGSSNVLILSDRLWRKLGSMPSVIGAELRLNGIPFTVVGVMPRQVDYPVGVYAWMATPVRTEMVGAAFSPSVIMRLRPDMSLAAAERELDRAAVEGVPLEYQDDDSPTLVSLQNQLTLPIRLSLLLLLAAAGVVVVIGCANVAALLLARISSRETEFMVRGALGAGAGRIARHVIAEAMLLGLCGGAVGLLFAVGGLQLLARTFPADTLPTQSVHLSGSALLFAAALSIGGALVFGCIPAVRAGHAARAVPRSATMTAGIRYERFRSALVVTEIALGVVLVLFATLLTRSLSRLESIPLGMQTNNVVVARVRLPSNRYGSPAAQVEFADRVLTRLRAMRGVDAAGMSSAPPLDRELGVGMNVERADLSEAQGGPTSMASYVTATPGYLEAVGARLQRGRLFEERDGTSDHAFIITETLSRNLFGSNDAVGRRINVPGMEREGTVVGVIDDIRLHSVTGPAQPVFIEPMRQAPTRYAAIAVRARNFGAAASAIHDAVREVDPGIPAYDVRRLQAVVASAIGPRHMLPRVVGLFATLAVMLCALGTYGLISEVVTRQRRATSIRMALGARPGQLVIDVLRRGFRLAGIGTALGLIAGVAGTRLLTSILYEIDPLDPATFAATPIVIAAVTVLALAPPALRVARLQAAAMLKE